MKHAPKNNRSRGWRLRRLVTVTIGLMVALRLAGSATIPPASEAKTHTLFMGADLDVQQGEELCRVQDVSEGAFIIRKNNELVNVPMNGGNVSMRIKQDLKLTDVIATIADLKKDRAYTKETDPHVKYLKESANFSGALSVKEIAEMKLQAVEAAQNGRISMEVPYLNSISSTPQLGAAGQVALASMNVGNAEMEARSTFNDPGHQAGVMQDELSRQLYDAMKVSFVVSSPKPLQNPYLVLIVQYRESAEKPGTAHNWVYASELDPIDQQPHLVSILKGGLPPGFILENFQLHLYNRGREVGTTASERRLALTQQEAFDYVLINYLGTHKGATLSASPAMGRLSPEARAQLDAGQFTQPFYVKVNKDGAPVGEYLDEACTQKVADSRVTALIDTVRFNPALDHGKPVDGTAKLKFNELSF